GGTITFGGGDGKITGKGTIRTSKLNFENVYYVEELQNFNLFSVSQICDKKNNVLFTDDECLVLPRGYVQNQNRTNHADHLHCLFAYFLSQLEPSSVATALANPDWVAAMQEEMQQFYHQQVWKLIPLPAGKIAIGTKWILKNNRNARGIVVRNKARLVAQGHRQEEGIDYDEGFEDPYNPKHVYRVVKALYGLHQAPRAWYARLSTFLLKHNYRRSTIDKTLFLKKDSRHIILVQVYVDDIIFSSTNKAWCDEFEVLMKSEFKMSVMGELAFFLGLQVKQLPDGIFISQDKYVKDVLKKFDMESVRAATTPYECKKQTVVATSSTEAEYVAAASCRGQRVSKAAVCTGTPAGGSVVSSSSGSYLFMLMNLFLLVVVLFLLVVHTVGLAGPSDIISTIDGNEVVVTKSLIRTQLQLDDVNMLYEFTLHDVLDGMRAIGYPTDGSLTFYKAKLSPQLRFLIHTLIHCMSPKSGGWNQFPSSLTSALICMSTGRTYNFSRFIMDGMLGNVGSKRHKFLMYPRFLQMILGWTPYASSGTHVPPVREHTPVREPTPVRDPLPRPEQEPTPDSPIPPFPPPSSAAVGPTTSSRPPIPSRYPSVFEDISEGGGDFASSFQSNEAPQTPAAMAAGGAEDSEFDLAALHTLASATLGDVSSAPAADPNAEATMPVHGTSTTRRRLRKQFTSSVSTHVSETIPTGVRVPAAATTIPAGSSVDAAVHAAAAPSSSIPTAADKGKAPMVDDSLPADLLSEQEREELAQKAQAESVASPTTHPPWMFDQRRQELDAAQLIYTEADWLDLLAKIATNSALSKQLLGDDFTEENMNERLGMLLLRKRRELAEQSRVKPMTKTQQRDYMPDFVKNSSASVYNQDAPPAKRATQGAPSVPAVSSQDTAGVLAAPSIHANVSLLAATSSAPATIPVPVVFIAHAAVSVPTEPMVHPAESHMDPPLTAPVHGSSEPTVAASSPSSSRHRRKHIGKKRVTPIVDVVDAAMIKFDSDSNSDDDPLPYAPYAGWEMVPSPLGSIHAYHNMVGHTKHFTTLRKILHMVERTDLQRLLGAVDALYQSEEPDTFALLLWGDLHVLFQSLDDTDALHFWRTMERMLKHGLEVSKLLVGGDLTMAEQLIGFIKAALLNAKSTD
nr:retrovirus-related Pol polyprotein from transposon TNT 1-94 [Tanacetum cinerariifolium]